MTGPASLPFAPGQQELAERVTARLDGDLQRQLVGRITCASGLCSLCSGSGHLMCHQDGKREFWACPACGGSGVRALFAPPTVSRRFQCRGAS